MVKDPNVTIVSEFPELVWHALYLLEKQKNNVVPHNQ